MGGWTFFRKDHSMAVGEVVILWLCTEGCSELIEKRVIVCGLEVGHQKMGASPDNEMDQEVER